MSETGYDLTSHLLSPSEEEVANTRVLFHTRHAAHLTEARFLEFGQTVAYHDRIHTLLKSFGLDVTPASDPEIFFRGMEFDYIYCTQIDGAFEGHEVLAPAIAALRGIPTLGPPAPVRALSEDKILGKALAASLGIEVARHRVIRPRQAGPPPAFTGGEWVVKPRHGVMSRDVTFVDSEASWRAALEDAAHPRHLGREFIAEEFIPGLNLCVPAVEGFPLPVFPVFIETGEPAKNILTGTGKEGQSEDYGSEPYAGPGGGEALQAAARMALALAPLDYARFDFRYDPARNRLVFLEVNMNCAMGAGAVVTEAAALCGIDHRGLVGHIFTHSLRRQRMML